MKWMVLGSSPSAPYYFGSIQSDRVISSGDGILLIRPDYYLVNEYNALDRHETIRLRCQAQGTKVLVSDYVDLHKHLGYAVDEVIPLLVPGEDLDNSWKRWEPGRYVFSVSGAVGLQYAVNHGATEIHMVGMEGYTGGADYFTGQIGHQGAKVFTTTSYAPLLRLIVSKCPGVQFITYGDLVYDLSGPNVTQEPTHA